MEKFGADKKVAVGPGGRLIFGLAAVVSFGLVALSPMTSFALPPSQDHQVFFPKTDHELHVYRIYGREPGKTILIIGGIHGNEPGSYLAADKYVDLPLRKGNLIIVPRANLYSILANTRGTGGDYNRKFDTELSDDNYDDKVIKILKQLIEQSDVLLNLHDGTGFYREDYVDEWHNPYRFGQSIIADCDNFYSDRFGEEIPLGEIARRVVFRLNRQIEEEAYQFRFNNHDSISPFTRYPEMRKTATYFALTENHIPAFGIETSKSLPSTEQRVAHQVIAINAFLEEFGVEVDVPDRSVASPKLDYIVVAVNDDASHVVRDGETLDVRSGDKVRIDHLAGNYERHMYADFEGLGGRNDNGREVIVTKPIKVKVRKDSDLCGSFAIVPQVEPESERPFGGVTSTANFILEINGQRSLVPAGEEIVLVRGDRLRVLDYIAPSIPEGINVNFLGFVGNPANNRGEDRNYMIDTARDLLTDWSMGGRGERYAIAVKLGKRELAGMTVRLLEPKLDYVVVRRNGGRPVVLQTGERWRLQSGDKLTVLGAHSCAPDDGTLEFHLFDAEGLRLPLEGNSFLAGSDGADGEITLAVIRGAVTMGRVSLIVDSSGVEKKVQARR